MSRSKRSRSGPSQPVEDYTIYLKDPTLLDAFKEMQSYDILPGRFIKYEDFALHNLKGYFANVGLDKLYSSENQKPYYPLLIKLFYTNLSHKKLDTDNRVITSLVKGKEISFSPKLLGKMLNIPYRGISLEDVSMDDEHILQNLIFLPGQGGIINHSQKLRPFPRFIARILAYNLYPKSGSFHFISLELAKALYAIMANIQVNWAEVYFENFLQIPYRGFLPFGALLTTIFEAFRVPLDSETSILRSVEFFDSNALTRMKIPNFELPDQQQAEDEPEHPQTQHIPQSSHQAEPSSSYIPEPSCFSDAQYNTLSARILTLETSQNLIFDQNISIMNNQREMMDNQQLMMRMFEDFNKKLDTFHGYQPPSGPTDP